MVCPETLAASVAALAITIANELDDDELAVLSAIFMQLGDTLDTILAQREYIDKHKC
ncbi:MAG: hypothetical protein K0R90_1452 [Oscillospiraceae bacterium]|jgi:thymidine phosphorylase|nr:hypothetical protein [Oscillospiraceae bacterium]